MAASKEQTQLEPGKSSNASEDSKNALNAQSVAGADGIQPMDFDESITGKK